jgi:hypothetical protein
MQQFLTLILHGTITKNLQKHTHVKDDLIRIWKLETAYIIPLVVSTMRIIPNKSHESLQLLNPRLALSNLMQTAVILNTCSLLQNGE